MILCYIKRGGQRLRRLVFAAVIFLSQAQGQTLLVPAYSPEVAYGALATARKGARVALIFNPADGPGKKADSDYVGIAVAARNLGVPLYGYLDLLSGGLGGPWKSPVELDKERGRYPAFYGGMNGYFFDDLRVGKDGTPEELRAAAAESRGLIIGNPGMRISQWPEGFDIVLIHEGPKWRQRAASKWERARWSKLGAFALEETDWKRAADVAKGLRFFYAHQRPDEWKNGNTAFSSLPSFWKPMSRRFSQ